MAGLQGVHSTRGLDETVRTSVRLAFCATLTEAIIGVIMCGVYILFYFCRITVACPSKDNNLEQVFFLFYTTYVKEKDNKCLVSNGNETIPENTTNDNELTRPRMIFFWQILFLVLYIAWVATALLLQQIRKRTQSALPWLIVTAHVLVAEVVSASLAATDLPLQGPGLESKDFSCPSMLTDDQDWADARKDWATTVLILYFTRCGIFWLVHLWALIIVTIYIWTNGKFVPGTISLGAETESTTELWSPSKTGPPTPSLWAPAGARPPSEHLSSARPPSEHLSSPGGPNRAHYSQPNGHYSQPQIRHQERSLDRPDGDIGAQRRPRSFAERHGSAETGGLSRDGALWGYTEPAVRKELMGRPVRKDRHLDQDVDSAFNFLETYMGQGEEEGSREVAHAQYSAYLAHAHNQSGQPEHMIPRAKVPPSLNSNGSAPGARYFVPLKH